MKRVLSIFSLLAITASASAAGCDGYEDYSFYIRVGSGVSFSQLADVSACYPPWSPVAQGYNARLGNCPIANLSVGCEFSQLVDVEVNFSNRSIFKYRKFQIPSTGTPNTREFDLNATSILLCANFLGYANADFTWDTSCGALYPVLGVGLGVSDLLITNYRTTGLPPTGDSSPYASFSSENQYTLRRHFTYAILAGIEYNHHDRWAVATGYRWFNAGRFEGPRYLRAANGSAVDVACDAWKMRLRANEWFIEFKILI